MWSLSLATDFLCGAWRYCRQRTQLEYRCPRLWSVGQHLLNKNSRRHIFMMGPSHCCSRLQVNVDVITTTISNTNYKKTTSSSDGVCSADIVAIGMAQVDIYIAINIGTYVCRSFSVTVSISSS